MQRKTGPPSEVKDLEDEVLKQANIILCNRKGHRNFRIEGSHRGTKWDDGLVFPTRLICERCGEEWRVVPKDAKVGPSDT